MKNMILAIDKNVLIECSCHDGKILHFTEPCENCRSTGWVKKPGKKRKSRCLVCDGTKHVRLLQPKVYKDCENCSGQGVRPINMYDQITKEDKELIFSLLFDFTEYLHGKSTFNEEYLGFGLIAGVIDYGRYLSMNNEQFIDEVKKNFMSRYIQYVSIHKNEKLPIKIIIKKHSTGWSALPIYDC